jgi:hypothetical protein
MISWNQSNNNKNGQMEQQKLPYNKENSQQNEKATYGMRENICKLSL